MSTIPVVDTNSAEPVPSPVRVRMSWRWRNRLSRPDWLPSPLWLALLALVGVLLVHLTSGTDLRRSADWPRATAVVTQNFDHRVSRGPRYTHSVRFPLADGQIQVKILPGRATVGSTVDLRYNPDQPVEVVVPSGLDRLVRTWTWLGVGLAVFGVVLAWVFPPAPRPRYRRVDASWRG